jgi:DNA-binding transcriptional LysR family regulator
MVGAGLGIALAPRTAVMNRLASIKVISLGGTVPARRVLVGHRKDRADTPVEAAFHKLLVEIGTSYDPE